MFVAGPSFSNASTHRTSQHHDRAKPAGVALTGSGSGLSGTTVAMKVCRFDCTLINKMLKCSFENATDGNDSGNVPEGRRGRAGGGNH